jgi:hypothetical protein
MTETPTALLTRLRELAAAPRDLAHDGLTIGVIGRDVPLELIDAAGARAVRLRGRPGLDTAVADGYLGVGIDPAARSLLAALLDESFAGLDGIVISSDSEASQRVFYLLRELRRVQPDLPVPPVHLVDVLHLPRETSQRYTLAKVRELRSVLADWAGAAVADDAIAEAVGARDEVRVLQRELSGLRRAAAPRLTGAEFLDVVLAGGRLSLTEYRDALRALIAGAGELPEHDGLRVVLTGSPHDEAGVTRAIEAAGALVVGEDHDGGDAAAGREIGAPTLESIALFAGTSGPTPTRAAIRVRAAFTAELVQKSSAQAVLSYVREMDDAPLWDFAALGRAPGIHSRLIDRQGYGVIDASTLTSAITDLSEEVARG